MRHYRRRKIVDSAWTHIECVDSSLGHGSMAVVHDHEEVVIHVFEFPCGSSHIPSNIPCSMTCSFLSCLDVVRRVHVTFFRIERAWFKSVNCRLCMNFLILGDSENVLRKMHIFARVAPRLSTRVAPRFSGCWSFASAMNRGTGVASCGVQCCRQALGRYAESKSS